MESVTNRQLLACCKLQKQNARVATLGTFAVRIEYQGHGLSKRLLVEAERYAHRHWGCCEMHLEVSKKL